MPLLERLHRAFVTSAWVLLVSAFATSQSAPNVDYLRKYVFIAPGSETAQQMTSSSYAVGGGAEQLLGKGFAAGIDLSALIPGKGKANNAIGSTSFNGYFHPIMKSNYDIFVTSGYSLMFRDFVANGFNFGGGVNFWYRENRGLYFEVREEAGQHKPEFLEHHFFQVRIGLSFR